MIDPRKTEIVNGQEVGEGWGKVLAEAQHEKTYSIRSEVFERIPFGEDYAGQVTHAPSCRDCAATRGQLHVPICCLEQCPRCGCQAISCNCQHDDDGGGDE